MSKMRRELTGDVISLLDPMKTVRAARTTNIPPLLCLACANSGESGECTQTGVDLVEVRARWNQQLTINPPDYLEKLKPDTPLVDICDQFKI